MAFNINDMRAQLVGGGARPANFQVILTNPINGGADFKSPFMIKATQLPTDAITSIPVPYFGRKVQVAGDRTFEDWTVTVINDEDFLVRNALEEWMSNINSHVGNLRLTGSSAPSEYKSKATVQQFSKTGDVVREYTFDGLFPTTISSIPLDWDTTDAIEEFEVTFSYDWWEVSGGSTGSASTTV